MGFAGFAANPMIHLSTLCADSKISILRLSGLGRAQKYKDDAVSAFKKGSRAAAFV